MNTSSQSILGSGLLKSGSACGRINDTYQIVKKIDKGGEAIVYKVRNPLTNEYLAAKAFFPKENARDQANQYDGLKNLCFICINQRFKDCPNILKVKDVLQDAQVVYRTNPAIKQHVVLMEYCEFKNLSNFVIDKGVDGRLPEPVARRIFLDVAEAIKEIHEWNMCHLDIKILNVLVTKHCQAVLTDMSSLEQAVDQQSGNLRHIPVLPATKTFSDPLPVEGMPYDGFKADVFSLGLLLYEILTGSRLQFSALQYQKKYLPNPAKYWDEKAIQNSRCQFTPSFTALMDMMLAPEAARAYIHDVLQSEWCLNTNWTPSLQILDFLESCNAKLVRTNKIKIKKKQGKMLYYQARMALSNTSMDLGFDISISGLREDPEMEPDMVLKEVYLQCIKEALYGLNQHLASSQLNLILQGAAKEVLSYAFDQRNSKIIIECILKDDAQSYDGLSKAAANIYMAKDAGDHIWLKFQPEDRKGLEDSKLCKLVEEWCQGFYNDALDEERRKNEPSKPIEQPGEEEQVVTQEEKLITAMSLLDIS